MTYCTAEDLKAEGVTAEMAAASRTAGLIALVTIYIDKMTGQWFEPRAKTLLLDSPGGPVLPLPVAPVQVDQVTADGYAVPAYQVDPDPDNPRLVARQGGRWPYARAAITVAGTFGYLENGETPILIRNLATRLVIRELPLATDVDGQEEKKRARITSESVDGHSYSLAQLAAAGMFTGDGELDAVLMRYQRPWTGGVV